MKTESKTTITTTGYFDKILKTHNCELGEWYGENTCSTVDLNSHINEIGLPKGEYKITITLELINN